MPMSGSTYILDGRDAELAQHNGHQVEVTGMMASSSSTGASAGTAMPGSSSASGSTGSGSSASGASAPTSGASTSTPGSGSTASSMTSAGGQRLQVTSIKMLASTCAMP
jgi:hypothetical protein